MKYIDSVEDWLDDKGYAIAREIQADGKNGEWLLMRIAFNEDGTVALSEDIMNSKFKHKLFARHQHELKTNKKIDMNIKETLQGLTIPQLESLKPSYYNLAIDARIAELKAMEAKPKKDAVTKTKRSRKKSTKATN